MIVHQGWYAFRLDAAQSLSAANLAAKSRCETDSTLGAFGVQFGRSAPVARQLNTRPLTATLNPSTEEGTYEQPDKPLHCR
jgi:hypothetical protein